MKVTALIESADHVCYRYRLNAMAWAFAEQELLLEGVPLSSGLVRLSALLAANDADIVILQRKLLPAWQLAILRRRAKVLVYDFDDALFRRDSFSSKRQFSSDRLTRFRRTICMADAVLAGNDHLGQFAGAFTQPGRVHVVPTCIEPGWYQETEHRRTGPWIRLAWIGQRSMLPSLLAASQQLAAVGRKLPGVTLRVICDSRPEIAGLRTELRPWSESNEATELAAADVGVSWLCDDLWSLGKCGLKVLQYMAAGLPVVANPVGIHRSMVVHGETGFLADTPDEWSSAVSRLADDPGLRRQMGAAGRRRVEADFNVHRWAPRVAQLLRNLVQERGRHDGQFTAETARQTKTRTGLDARL